MVEHRFERVRETLRSQLNDFMRTFIMMMVAILVMHYSLSAQLGSWNVDARYRQHSEILANLSTAQCNQTRDTLTTVQQDTGRCVIKRWLTQTGSLIDSVEIPVKNGQLNRDGTHFSSYHIARFNNNPPIDTVYADIYSTRDGSRILSCRLKEFSTYSYGYYPTVSYDNVNDIMYAFIPYYYHIPLTPNRYTEINDGNLYYARGTDSIIASEYIGSVNSWSYSSVFQTLLSCQWRTSTYFFVSGGFYEEQKTSSASFCERTNKSTVLSTVPEISAQAPATCMYALHDSCQIFAVTGAWYRRTRQLPDSLQRVAVPYSYKMYTVDDNHFAYLVRDSVIIVAHLETMIGVDTIVTPTAVASISCISPESLLVVGIDKRMYLIPSRRAEIDIARYRTSTRVGYRGLRVNFIHAQPHTTQRWYWNFGDGTIDSTSGASCTHVYNDTGLYHLRLDVLSTVGTRHTSTDSYSVLIVPDLQIGFEVDTTWGSAPLPVTCTNTSSGSILATQWDFDDGFTDTARSALHLFSAQKCHSIKLTIRDTLKSLSLTKPCIVFPSDVPLRRIDFSSSKRVRPEGFISGTTDASAAFLLCEPFGQQGILSTFQMLSRYVEKSDPRHILNFNDLRLSYVQVDNNHNQTSLFTGASHYTQGFIDFAVTHPYTSLISIDDSAIISFKFYYGHEGYGDYSVFGTTATLNLPVQSSNAIGSMLKRRQLSLQAYYAAGDSTLASLSDLYGKRPIRTLFLRGNGLRMFNDRDGAYFCICSKADSARNILVAHVDTAFKLRRYDTLHTSVRVTLRDMMKLSNGNYMVTGNTAANTPTAYCAVLSPDATLLAERIYPRWVAFGRITALRDGGAYILCGQSTTSFDFAAYALVDSDGMILEDGRMCSADARVRDMCLARDQQLWFVGLCRQDTLLHNGSETISITNGGFTQHIPTGAQLLSDVDENIDDDTTSSVTRSRVYPQPADDHIRIACVTNMPQQITIAIYSLTSEVVFSTVLNASSLDNIVSIPRLANGTYAVVVRDDTGSVLSRSPLCILHEY